jgi:CheY-like chemotaxis protein
MTTASSGEQALDLMGRESFELVITDLGLGAGMNGWEVADAIRERYLAAGVILASGWGAEISPEEAAAHSVVAVVAKPYSARDVRQMVASIAGPGVSACARSPSATVAAPVTSGATLASVVVARSDRGRAPGRQPDNLQ